MTTTLQHASLRTTLQGIQSTYDDVLLSHFRGIPYGQIPKRYGAAVIHDSWDDGELDCTSFG